MNEVGLAELIVAHEALRPRGKAVAAMVEMCGLEYVGETQEDETKHRVPQPGYEDDLNEPEGAPVGGGEAMGGLLSPSVRHLQPVRRGGGPESLPGADPLLRRITRTEGPGPFTGLLARRDAIDLLWLAASVPVDTDRIRVDEAVKRVAEARPLLSLPRVQVPSFALGAQVLVDVGEPMGPFRDDQEDLVRRMKAVVGDVGEIRYFSDTPYRGTGTGLRRSRWSRYSFPGPGTPVIVLSDLGCGFPPRPDPARAWIDFAARLRRRQSRLVAFAPVRPVRIPPALHRVADIVVWDRAGGRRNASRLTGRRDA